MSQTLAQVQELVRNRNAQPSQHGYIELTRDGLFFNELIEGIENAVVVEDYPKYAKGPCVLVLQFDGSGKPVHVLWGIELGTVEPAVLITAYRPDPKRWDSTLTGRTS